MDTLPWTLALPEDRLVSRTMRIGATSVHGPFRATNDQRNVLPHDPHACQGATINGVLCRGRGGCTPYDNLSVDLNITVTTSTEPSGEEAFMGWVSAFVREHVHTVLRSMPSSKSSSFCRIAASVRGGQPNRSSAARIDAPAMADRSIVVFPVSGGPFTARMSPSAPQPDVQGVRADYRRHGTRRCNGPDDLPAGKGPCARV